MRFITTLLTLGLLLTAGPAIGQIYEPGTNSRTSTGEIIRGTLDIASGGELDIQSGGTITFSSGSTVTLTNTIDFDDIVDSMTLDADTDIGVATGLELSITATSQVGINEILTFLIDQADDADATDVLQALRIELASESGDANDEIRGIVITIEEGTANTIIDAALLIDNEETTASTLTDAILISNTGASGTGITDGLDVSVAGIVNAVNIGENYIKGGNDELLTVGASDNVVELIVETAGESGTFRCNDDSTPAGGCIFTGNGTTPVTVGTTGQTTSVTIAADGTTDGDFVVPGTSIGAAEIVLDTLTFAQISDSSAIDAATTFTAADGITLTLTPTMDDTTGAFLVLNADQADDADGSDNHAVIKIDATSESEDGGDTFVGIDIEYEEGTFNTVMDAAIAIDNEETTAATMTDAIIVESSGVNLGVTDGLDVSAANILNAVNIGGNLLLGVDDSLSIGATDDTVILDSNDSDGTYTCTDADANANCSFAAGGTGTAKLGSSTNLAATVVVSDGAGGSNITNFDDDGVTLPLTNHGGNADHRHRFVGVPKLSSFGLGQSTSGDQTVSTDFIDDADEGTLWTATANVTRSSDASTWRKGTTSLKLLVGSTPADTNGADNPLTSGDQDWSADESFGLWHRCDTVYNAGDWVLGVTDNASEDVTTQFPAYGTAEQWAWTELEIGSIADGDKDVITDISFSLSAAGATTFAAGGSCYFDYAFKWDAAQEEALDHDILEDGVIASWKLLNGGGAVNDVTEVVEGTDFLIHYETGNDFFIAITDHSNDTIFGLAALE